MYPQVCWDVRGNRSAVSSCTSAGSCLAPADSEPPPADPSDTGRLWHSTSSHLGIRVIQVDINLRSGVYIYSLPVLMSLSLFKSENIRGKLVQIDF
ncbi:hypothetical protein GOODEAATRI_025156 [Goodea atripinnis]|uniref:Uncharacterized protein n=1 Tax=Goodea atripinnis TaxID=208336 RepID=A0ABV0PGW5_9TELE